MTERHSRRAYFPGSHLPRLLTMHTGALTRELVPYVRREEARDAEVAAQLAAIRAEATRRAGPFCDDCGYRTRTDNHLKRCGGAS